jgi:spermidine synthase
MQAENFFMEYSENEIHLHGIKRIVASLQTKYQKASIVDTHNYGRTLFLDDRVQSSERDSFIYHEALVHLPMLLHPSPRRVLVVGGGEGETLRTVLEHPGVERAVMCDIDGELVRLCARHLPEWSGGAFRDRRTKMVIDDARAWLQRSKQKFDIIIIDLPEPVEGGPAIRLYTREFYKLVHSRLTEHGMITLQAGTTKPGDTGMLGSIAWTIATSFPVVSICQVNVPSFGLPWGLIFASKGIDPLTYSPSQIDKLIAGRRLRKLRFYDGVAHQGMFALPRYLRQDLCRKHQVISDKKALVARFK